MMKSELQSYALQQQSQTGDFIYSNQMQKVMGEIQLSSLTMIEI